MDKNAFLSYWIESANHDYQTMLKLVSKQGLSLESIYWSPRHRKIDKGYLCK